MATQSFTGNDTFLLRGVLIPSGLGSDTAVSITFPNAISDTIVGYDGSIGAALLKNGLKAEVTINTMVGQPLANALVALQREWSNSPSSLTDSTFVATKITDNKGSTYSIALDVFVPMTIAGFTSSSSSAKDSLELEFQFSGILNQSKS